MKTNTKHPEKSKVAELILKCLECVRKDLYENGGKNTAVDLGITTPTMLSATKWTTKYSLKDPNAPFQYVSYTAYYHEFGNYHDVYVVMADNSSHCLSSFINEDVLAPIIAKIEEIETSGKIERSDAYTQELNKYMNK